MEDWLFPPSLPRTRFFRVEAHRTCPPLGPKDLTASHMQTFTLLLVKLMWAAGDIEPDESGIRLIELNKVVMLQDGTELAPLSVYFRMSEDGIVAHVLDVEKLLDATEVEVSPYTITEILTENLRTLIATKEA